MVHYAAFRFGVAMTVFGKVPGPARRTPRRGRLRRRGRRPLSSTAAAADPAKVLRIAFPTAETGFDPVRVSDLYSATVNEAIFERLLDLRLPRAAGEARPDGRRGHARSRRERQGLHVPHPERHPLHARSGVQGREARADRAGLRLFVHAVRGPEEPLAVRVPGRGQDRGPGRARRQGEEDRQVRLRRQDTRHGGGRPLHAALPAQAARLQLPLRHGDGAVVGRGARSGRGLRRRHAWRIRSAPVPTC